jgi:hypothetical protein
MSGKALCRRSRWSADEACAFFKAGVVSKTSVGFDIRKSTPLG